MSKPVALTSTLVFIVENGTWVEGPELAANCVGCCIQNISDSDHQEKHILIGSSVDKNGIASNVIIQFFTDGIWQLLSHQEMCKLFA